MHAYTFTCTHWHTHRVLLACDRWFKYIDLTSKVTCMQAHTYACMYAVLTLFNCVVCCWGNHSCCDFAEYTTGTWSCVELSMSKSPQTCLYTFLPISCLLFCSMNVCVCVCLCVCPTFTYIFIWHVCVRVCACAHVSVYALGVDVLGAYGGLYPTVRSVHHFLWITFMFYFFCALLF